jgi:serine/threonine protein kinase
MVKSWRQFEGATIDRKYQLINCLAETGLTALFAAQSVAEESVRALVKLEGGGEWQERRLAVLGDIAGVVHPNLLRIQDFGVTEAGGITVVYTVIEWADENLAEALKDRALSPEEAAQLTAAVLDGLESIHSRGFVHGQICPAAIFAAGDTIKISGDTLCRPGERAEDWRPAGPYDAPEIAESGCSAAADVWSLGMTLLEAVSGRGPAAGGEQAALASTLPAPFSEIVTNCVRTEPAERWTLSQIRERLNPVREIRLPETPAERKSAAKWAYAGIAAAALLAAVILLQSNQSEEIASRPVSSPRPAAPAVSTPPAALAVPAATPPAASTAADQKPSPYGNATSEASREAPAAPAGERPYWRVIVYTFSRLDHAEGRARAVTERWPDFRAEVFDPTVGQGPYLVSIGGRMSREEAARLRENARAKGLPQDTYIQNYSR